MLGYKTKRIAWRRPDGSVRRYIEVPDKSDPAFQAEMQASFERLDAALDEAARQAGMTRDELVDELTRE